MGVRKALVCVVLLLAGLGSTGCICSVKSMETDKVLTELKAPPAQPDAKISVASFVVRSGPHARYGTGYGYRYDMSGGSQRLRLMRFAFSRATLRRRRLGKSPAARRQPRG